MDGKWLKMYSKHTESGPNSINLPTGLGGKVMAVFLSPLKRIDDINIAELPPRYTIERFYIPSQSDIYFEPNRTSKNRRIFNGTKCGVPKEYCFSILKKFYCFP